MQPPISSLILGGSPFYLIYRSRSFPCLFSLFWFLQVLLTLLSILRSHQQLRRNSNIAPFVQDPSEAKRGQAHQEILHRACRLAYYEMEGRRNIGLSVLCKSQRNHCTSRRTGILLLRPALWPKLDIISTSIEPTGIVVFSKLQLKLAVKCIYTVGLFRLIPRRRR